MHELIKAKRREIIALCRKFDVRQLDLFGSAVGNSFNVVTSDVDFLVEFNRPPGFDYFNAYFGLKEGLEDVLGRKVDLVVSAGIRNPYFKEAVMKTKEALYAA